VATFNETASGGSYGGGTAIHTETYNISLTAAGAISSYKRTRVEQIVATTVSLLLAREGFYCKIGDIRVKTFWRLITSGNSTAYLPAVSVCKLNSNVA
jgi:hypothetical protein